MRPDTDKSAGPLDFGHPSCRAVSAREPIQGGARVIYSIPGVAHPGSRPRALCREGEDGIVKHVHVNGVDLEYLDQGTGAPVVFSHGAGSDLRYWEPQREAFAARCRFIAYSRRFHGPGPWPAKGDDSAEAHTTDLGAIMRGLVKGPVHLVGFSTTIALRATLRQPELVRSLTIVEPNVPWLLEGDPEGEYALAWWRAENDRVRSEAGGDAERRAKLWFELVNNRGPGMFDAQPEALRRMWLDNFDKPGPSGASPQPVTCAQLGAITTPTLAVGGEYGIPYSRRIVDVLAGCIPESRLLLIPGVTHFMSYQDPDLFNEAVLEFVAQH
jgi:non-heme chloroperoxidase